MGCGASLMQKQEPAEAKVAPMLGPGAKSTRSPLTKEQINSRIVCSPKTVKSKITDKLTVQYAYVSQRGYYPDVPEHAVHAALVEFTKRVIFVCKKTNWDFIGLIATPHTVLFAHDDVYVPPALDETLSVVRHSGVDSYLNLHNKTLTIMSHVHASDPRSHLLKQDEEAVIFWPHYYQCLKQCKDLGSCYAGDMHVNIGGAANANSYVFATGGSYFVGNKLLACLLAAPAKVELDGLDYGEDKMVGKMLHYNKCGAQIVSCKWFNNREVYSPNAVLKMVKQYSVQIKDDSVLLSQAEIEEQRRAQHGETEPGQH